MKKTLRIFAMALLTMVSMEAWAKIDVQINNDGKFDGGTIEVTGQKDLDDGVEVTITVAPDKGYTIKKGDISVFSTISPSGSRVDTRAPEIAKALTLYYNGSEKEDAKDLSAKRDYTFIVPTGFGAWVKEATFSSESKEEGPTRTVFSGVWYIANETNHSNANTNTHWYLVPGANPQTGHYADAYFNNQYCNTSGSGDYTGDNYGDVNKPFLTTYQTKQDLNSIWIVVSTGDGYYNIIHAKTGSYVVYEPPYQDAPNRKSMHLDSTPTGNNAKFAITGSLSGPINIRPLKVTSGNQYFNPAIAQGNYPRYYGTGTYFHEGMIGLYSGSTDKSQWYFEDASSATTLTPVISDVDESTNTFTITSPAAAFSTIHYTTDGSTTPDASTGTTATSGSPITITDTWNVQAVGVSSSFVTPVAGPKDLSPVATPPTINYNNATGLVTISSATALSYYYTTNGNTPTTSSTPYNNTPFSVTTPTTVKAIAIYAGGVASEPTTLEITQVATPTIQNNGSNAISITTTTPAATIYYTTDGNAPTTSSTEYTGPLTENVSNVTIKAIAVKEGMITSAIGSGSVKLQCATPVITRDGLTFTLSCSMPTDATLYYSLDGGSEVTYPGTPVSFTSEQLPMTVTAVAKHSNYTDSETASKELINGSGTTDDPYMIFGTTDFTNFVTNVNNGTTASACYKLGSDVSASGMDAITTDFTGTFDGSGYTISNLGHALFNSVNGGTVKNVILDNVVITDGTNVGAICNEATGETRIYNCGVLATDSGVETDKDGYTDITSYSSSVSGSGYVGGIVGLLDGSSRVINCFSYAEIKNGSEVGGIVGHNNVATTSAADNQKTMVMNCMFYGDITGGSSKAPIYNGEIITNRGDQSGVSNFNYFRQEAAFVRNLQTSTDKYNCALAAETRYLQRFEFFRHLLNSNRELAAWWATGSRDNKDEMMKWVLEPSQIGTSTPYPILKTPGRYKSIVYIDDLQINESTHKGTSNSTNPRLSTLNVTIQMGDGAVYEHPTNASIVNSSLTLDILDKDPAHFNFNYKKVQLPYYNDVGTKNYTGNRVVTGWKIVSISDGSHHFSNDNDDAMAEVSDKGVITLTTPYNFADRHCTEKDLYSVSGRIFNQGAYWDVPEGVTAITIQPYWAKAAYLADAYADVTYNQNMNASYNVPNVGGGQIYTNGNSYNINGNGDDNDNQVVYTSISNAIGSTALNPNTSHTVYDYAVVLVGNYHHYYSAKAKIGGDKPYTITSIDLDGDNEPDYSYILRFDNRCVTHPVRVDFLNIPGLGMAQKSAEGTGTYNFGIMQPKGWFEATNTALFRVTQLEYDLNGRSNAPMILQGGVIEQWVTYAQGSSEANAVEYYHVGGNVWFKEFHIGQHQDRTEASAYSPHPPISVTGGDYDEFYLTGYYNTPTYNYPDNAECYINGGRFGKVAGTGMQGIGKTGGADNTGNIIWQIDNADIDEFYAGGMNAAHKAEGNIWTVISNSRVDQFCGGPKFGDMNDKKVVVTNATNCTFRTFFGAGYGGNSYNRRYPTNQNDKVNIDWNLWVSQEYTNEYNATYKGVETRIDYQFLPMSGNTLNVCRLFVDYVCFSLATTRDVTSKLTGCIITKSPLGRLKLFEQCLGNFYGGGSLGKVDGPVNSTLTDCTVEGNVFGAGYSATLPTVAVMNNSFQTEPKYDENLGAYLEAELPATKTYSWQHADIVNSTKTAINTTDSILYTTEDLTALGKVTGTATLNIVGTTKVYGNVYGGGEESNVEGNTQVVMSNGTIGYGSSGDTEHGNVFGGGKGVANNFQCDKAMVGESGDGSDTTPGGTNVTITGGAVMRNVYGGGEVGRVEKNTIVTIGVENEIENETKSPVINGSVFGAGQGKETHGYSALVRGNSTVTIQGNAKVAQNVYGGGEKSTAGRYWVKGIVEDPNDPAPESVPDEMPYKTKQAGVCTVNILDYAQIGPDGAASENAGHVFGAGMGVEPHYVYNTGDKETWSRRMVDYAPNREKNPHTDENKGSFWWPYDDPEHPKYVWEYFVDDDDPTAANYKTGEDKYLEFLQTLALVTQTHLTINEGAKVKGNVYGGSQSGFVQDDTDVKILGGTIGTTTYGNVFGGGKGLPTFAEAGKVKGNTNLTINDGTIYGNVYGGGSLGDVGRINKDSISSYKWTDEVITSANYKSFEWNQTGVCNVTINNGIIGTDGNTQTGHVFGAGKGLDDTWWCEKAMAYKTNVTVNAGMVKGSVYGGGQVGRVEGNAKVVIGTENESGGDSKPTINGSVFGAGAGLYTHGYSALVRGNSDVTVQGTSLVGGSVYGGGEIASVGRFTVVGGLPKHPDSGGYCIVTIQDNAKIGSSGTGHNVYGACKGVDPDTVKVRRSMQLYENRPKNGVEGTDWSYYTTYSPGYEGQKFIWVYYSEDDYPAFLKTLALTSHPHVTIAENASVYGSIYGGGQRGITLGHVDVDITGGTVAQDVYGGGALADTNLGNWDENEYEEIIGLTVGKSPVKGFYTRSGSNTESYIYTIVSDGNPTPTAVDGTTYYRKGRWAHESKSAWYTTHVSLTGGTIVGDAYGGGLGQKEYGTKNQSGYEPAIEAQVYGDVLVELNGKTTTENSTPTTTKVDDNEMGCIVNRVFGCNNLNGTPKGKVQVYVYATQSATTNGNIKTKTRNRDNPGENPYDVQAVYGGGNLAPYIPYEATLNDDETNTARTEVYIDGCFVTSIKQVYGGGNAAPVPATYVEVMTAYEIDEVFGGGNGADKYSLLEGGATKWYENPGANVGYYTYASYPKTGDNSGAGEEEDPWNAVEISKFSGGSDNKANRLSEDDPDAIALRYGSGIATLLVEGGTIHTSYGGSNSKGNVRAKLASTYSSLFGDGDPCAMAVGTSYGGGKNAYSDADAEVSAECAKGVKEMFGGSKDADFNGNIDLRITNGSSLERVFGGNNTSGAVNGSITVTIEEGGCEPIHIGSLYAGGYLAPYSVYGYNDDKTPKESGERLYADPRINVISATRIDNIFGGGYQAKLVGNPHINVNMKPGRILASYVVNTTENPFVGEHKDENNKVIYVGKEIEEGTGDGILEIGTIGTIYGGGNMADIIGSTFVEIGTGTWHNQDGVLETVSTDGKTYTYNESTKKWVDTDNADNTSETAPEPVRYTATITGNVYGGGNNADVKENTYVTISGRNISGNTTPKGSTTIDGSVYGGGNLGSVGTFNVIGTAKPTSCSTGTGLCTVTIDGYAEIGPDNMKMITETGYPNDAGHVFGASRGEVKAPTDGSDPSINTEVDYKTFVDKTEVTIGGYAFVKGSVYGGSENGHVLHDTHVVITDKCQIGNGDGVNRRYTDAEWAYDGSDDSKSLAECAHWIFDKDDAKPFDIYDYVDATAENPIPNPAKDGHTFYGNVFGGGSGYYPYGEGAELSSTQISLGYSKGAWLREAGAVYGNTVVDITGGHILTSVYGGNEQTDVTGTCTINMSDGTVGVPRTVAQAKAHPVTCYVFGAGKGDQRINFNTWTNVASTQVNISGKARIFGSAFGGGEDGHVIGNAETNIIAGNDIGGINYPYIGTTGTSSVDGNIFGGGRGFSETALTAGVVGGNTTVNFYGGTLLGTVFGGGRLASVGTNFANAEDATRYGKMQGDVSDMNHGVIRINIYGGTIGATDSDGKLATSEFSIGDVFGGSKGSMNNDLRFGLAKHTYITMTGGKVNGSVYGGGEVAVVEGNTTIDISGGKVGDGVTSKGGDKIGNVYGGGKGNTGHVKAGLIMGNTNVTIQDGTSGNTTTTPRIYHNVYGGGAYGSVGTFNYDSETSPTANITGLKTANTGVANITITGGTIGTNGNENGMIFGSSRGDVDYDYTNKIDPNDRLAWVYSTDVKIGNSGQGAVFTSPQPQIYGSVYGSGENGHTWQNTVIDIYSGTIGTVSKDDAYKLTEDGVTYVGADYPYRGNVYGGGCGTDKYASNAGGSKDTYNPLAGIVRGTTTVNIRGGQVAHNVYGAGAMGSVGGSTDAGAGKTTINITGGRIGDDGVDDGNIYGAARGDTDYDGANSDNLAQVRETDVNIQYATTPASDNEGHTEQLITGSVFGGGEAGIVTGDVAVNMLGGRVLHDVYGGGALASSNKDQYRATDPTNAKTIVNLLGGAIEGDAYGGGLGRLANEDENVTAVEAFVGNTKVNLNGLDTGDYVEAIHSGKVQAYKETESSPVSYYIIPGSATGCSVRRVFGCNNLNGTPKGNAVVHVYRTQGYTGHTRTPVTDLDKEDDNEHKYHSYEVDAVYGGGNLSAYIPKDLTEGKTHVIIEGCDLTSIRQVYGGGNAASTPATLVDVHGSYEIEEVFGGGNGMDDISLDGGKTTIINPGANVGFKDYWDYDNNCDLDAYNTKEKRQTNTTFLSDYVYGSGKAEVNINSGRVHRVFGGSNTRGNVRETALTILEDEKECDFFNIDEAYGGGKSAPMDAEAKLLLSCIPQLKVVYGGAQDADISNDVVLNISNGTFDRVFGGNNKSGSIHGTITVNIEETGCKPVIIGQLYGGGNLAPYIGPLKAGSQTERQGPTVNVKAFTSIGEIYGGGFGAGADVTGDTYVNINEVILSIDDTRQQTDYSKLPFIDTAHPEKEYEDIELSDGSKYRLWYRLVKNAGTDDPVPAMGVIGNVYGGGNEAKVIGNTYVNIGNKATETIVTLNNLSKDVKGVDIRGNVYGGGNQADVTGDTNVKVGKE